MTPAATFAGTLYRALFVGGDPRLPVTSPVGRFHHSGQGAIYGSLTPEGCAVAIRRYLRADDPPRHILPLSVRVAPLADLRGRPELSVVWQDGWAAGIAPPTWTFSDAARTAGAQGLLYSSRSRPDLTHLVLFDPAAILSVGAALPFAR